MLTAILEASEVHVRALFDQADTSELLYHNLQHTEDVVQRCVTLSAQETEEAQFLVQIAAWFHDVGYLEAYDHHEQRGMRIAADYLTNQGLSSKQIQVIVNCIEATTPPLGPRTELEAIIKDADIGFGVTENFFETGPRLRREWELKLDKYYSDNDWETLQLNFLSQVQLHSKLGQQYYQNILEENRSKQKAKV